MIGAIVQNDLVQNLIVIKEENIPELEKALNCEIVDARPYGLVVAIYVPKQVGLVMLTVNKLFLPY